MKTFVSHKSKNTEHCAEPAKLDMIRFLNSNVGGNGVVQCSLASLQRLLLLF